MSVIVTVSAKGDPKGVEEYASANADAMQAIVRSAKEHGVVAHRFYGSDDGQVLVLDEWPEARNFQDFFEHNQERIGPIMQAAGAQGEPRINFWHKLETHDEVGWGS